MVRKVLGEPLAERADAFAFSGPPARKAVDFLKTLRVPEGPRAGKPLKLAPFQREFVKNALKKSTSIAALSVGRGNGKTALSAGLALGELLGIFDPQPRREVILAARVRDQARVAWNFVEGFCRSLPDDIQAQLKFRRAPALEIEFTGNGGGLLRAISSDGKNALGSAPSLILMDERGHWAPDQGDALEAALLSGAGKRGGRILMISTSAPDDSHTFSRWLDNPPLGAHVQEYRPAPGIAADDLESLLHANPGCGHGIGSTEEWLLAEARRAIARGGSALANFRLFNRNERVSADSRDLLLTTDQWLGCETADLPPRSGPCVVGIDLGGSASMSAAAFFWPETGRLECRGTFPGRPGLLDRGQADGVGSRYCEMSDRGELTVLGDAVVPAAAWLSVVASQLDGQPIAALCADRYRQAEVGEAIDKAGIRCPIAWRGQGFRDGSEDVERFRRSVFDGKVKALPSLLMRSAFGDAVCLIDPAGNCKLAKGRSTGRIDAVAAAVLAVAHGDRLMARPARAARAPVWA